MLESDARSTQLQRWYDRLMPLVERARQDLQGADPDRLAARGGCARAADGALRLSFAWRAYDIRPGDLTVTVTATGQPADPFTQALLLTYLLTADGTPPSTRWIAYRELPGGMFYAQAFAGYAEQRLVRGLGAGGLDAFRQAAARLEGAPIPLGDAGYAFPLLPRVHLAAVYWLGDEDFPSRTSILFADTAPHYMTTDGLAVLGSHLVDALLSPGR